MPTRELGSFSFRVQDRAVIDRSRACIGLQVPAVLFIPVNDSGKNRNEACPKTV